MSAHPAETHPARDADLVSVLVRSMDRPTLDRALDSAAAQTWPDLEIVVVAACGRSHRALPNEYRGRALRLVFGDDNRRLPRPEAANIALDAARGILTAEQWKKVPEDARTAGFRRPRRDQ